MKLLDIIKQRRSVRKYLPAAVEQEKIDYIMECARLAPSACNLQPWKFFVIKDEGVRRQIAGAYPAGWFSQSPAPVLIVACADTGKSWKRSYDGKDYADVDLAIAFEHICLAAAETGLGTCWIAHFDPKIVRAVLKPDDGLEPVAMTPLGYPDLQDGTRTPRKTIGEITVVL